MSNTSPTPTPAAALQLTGSDTPATDTTSTTQYVYNNLGGSSRRSIRCRPSASCPTTCYFYDANGNLVGVTDTRGSKPTTLGDLSSCDPAYTTKYLYDELNRKIEDIVPDVALASQAGSPPLLYTWYYYDNDGNLTYVVNANGAGARDRARFRARQTLRRSTPTTTSTGRREIQPSPSTDAWQPTTTYTYNAQGNLAETKDPNGNPTQYVYNLAGRLGHHHRRPGRRHRRLVRRGGQRDLGHRRPGPGHGHAYDSMNRKTAVIEPVPDNSNFQAARAHDHLPIRP